MHEVRAAESREAWVRERYFAALMMNFMGSKRKIKPTDLIRFDWEKEGMRPFTQEEREWFDKMREQERKLTGKDPARKIPVEELLKNARKANG